MFDVHRGAESQVKRFIFGLAAWDPTGSTWRSYPIWDFEIFETLRYRAVCSRTPRLLSEPAMSAVDHLTLLNHGNKFHHDPPAKPIGLISKSTAGHHLLQREHQFMSSPGPMAHWHPPAGNAVAGQICWICWMDETWCARMCSVPLSPWISMNFEATSHDWPFSSVSSA